MAKSYSRVEHHRFALPALLVATIPFSTQLAVAQTSETAAELPPVVVDAPQPKPKASASSNDGSGASQQASTTPPVQDFQDPDVVAEPPAGASESTGIGPLTQGNDVTIGGPTLQSQQPSTIQGLFAGQTTVSAGGTTQSSTKVYVHGVEETLLNVQIDGARQPQRNGFHHNGNNLIDPAMLKSVAIDAGASPADAGAHALGGSIRYTTKDATDFLKPGQTMGGFGKLSYDTNAETFTKSGAAYAALNGLEILGYGLQADGEAYEDGDDNEVFGTNVDLLNFLGKVAIEAPSGDRFAFSGEYIRDEGIRPVRANLGFSSFGGVYPYTYNESERETYTFKYLNTKPSDLFNPEISLFYNKNTLNRPSPETPCAGGFGCTAFGVVEIESVGGKAQNTFKVGRGALTIGGDFYRDEVTTTRSNIFAPFDGVFDETLTNVGAFAQYRLALAEPFRLSVGLRVDHNELDSKDGQTFENTGVSPNVSAEYDLTHWLTAKASYGYSFGGIPTYEAILFRPTNPIYSPTLDPQWGQTAKAGLLFKNGGFQAEASYFDTRIIDPVCANCTVGDTGPVVNLGDIEINGVDISAQYSWRNARLAANYTHTESDFGDGPLLTTSYYYGTPFGDILKLSGFYQFEGTGVTVGFLSQFAFEYDDLANVPFPRSATTYGKLEAYDVHNVFAEWKPEAVPNLTLRADVLNLFDEFYVDRATAVGGTLVPLTSQGRTFVLSGKVEF